jgi:hypothetical protein
MAKKPSPERGGVARRDVSSAADDVAALRGMSREERLLVLMRGLDATCGPAPARRREPAPAPDPKSRRKN